MNRNSPPPLGAELRKIVEAVEIDRGWLAVATAPGELADAPTLRRVLDEGSVRALAASVPGTAPAASGDPDALDWWFVTELEASPLAVDEELVLCLEGLATIAEVYVGEELVLRSESMFEAHEVDVGSLLAGATASLSICCRALAPLLSVRRRPRARWRARLAVGNLRFHRTMLMGRAPGFAPGPAVVGPWRPVRLVRRRAVAVEDLVLRARVSDGDGLVGVSATLRAIGSQALPERASLELAGPDGEVDRAELAIDGTALSGELRLRAPALWWPHTHGPAPLYEVTLVLDQDRRLPAGRIGFRTVRAAAPVVDGLTLQLNGVPVFARGAVWTPPHAGLRSPAPGELRDRLQALVDTGMNVVRIPGTACYETAEFHDLCDELGILVWQDLMFANLDYPETDEGFMAAVQREVAQVLAVLGSHASLAVVCGSSEVAQQVAMMGLDPALASGPLFGELIPSLVEGARLDAVYVPSAPCGGTRPFRPDRGVASYFGVGGYMRPLEDARQADVKFAAECLAFSNVPDDEAIADMSGSGAGALAFHDPRWKAGIPRDPGAGWDFEDVRDHYLRLLYGEDPVQLRRIDHERYLELSRAVTGEVMAEVLGEWRRPASPCAGAIILWLADLQPGAGWGLLDHRGAPKVAYHHVRRALAPVAVWMTDEGMNGIAVHVANDLAEPLHAQLALRLYRDLSVRVGEATQDVDLGPHEAVSFDLEDLLGRFVDASWAYRFGPPAQDLIVATLEREGQAISRSFRLPAGRASARLTADEVGLAATGRPQTDGSIRLRLSSRRYAHGVRVSLPGFVCEDDAFSLEPGTPRDLAARPTTAGAGELGSVIASGTLTALNLDGRVRIEERGDE